MSITITFNNKIGYTIKQNDKIMYFYDKLIDVLFTDTTFIDHRDCDIGKINNFELQVKYCLLRIHNTGEVTSNTGVVISNNTREVTKVTSNNTREVTKITSNNTREVTKVTSNNTYLYITETYHYKFITDRIIELFHDTYAVSINNYYRYIYLFDEKVIIKMDNKFIGNPYDYYKQLRLITKDSQGLIPIHPNYWNINGCYIGKKVKSKYKYTLRYTIYPEEEYDSITEKGMYKLYIETSSIKLEITKNEYVEIIEAFGKYANIEPIQFFNN